MSERDDFQQIQKLSLEQIQTQRASQNQVLLGQLIEMNDEEIKDRIEVELNDNPALEEASDSHQDDYDYGSSDEKDESQDDKDSQELGNSNEDPFESPYTVTDEDYDDRNDDGLGISSSLPSISLAR